MQSLENILDHKPFLPYALLIWPGIHREIVDRALPRALYDRLLLPGDRAGSHVGRPLSTPRLTRRIGELRIELEMLNRTIAALERVEAAEKMGG